MLVSELLDYVAQGFELPGQDIVEGHVLTRHRLQAFSTAYFRGGRLFSYSRENLKASQVIPPERRLPGDFIPRPLADPEPEWRRLTMQTLAEFLCNPAKFLAVKRLGLRLPSERGRDGRTGGVRDRRAGPLSAPAGAAGAEDGRPEPEGLLRTGQGVRAAAGRHRRQRPFCPDPPGCRGVLQAASAVQARAASIRRLHSSCRSAISC